MAAKQRNFPWPLILIMTVILAGLYLVSARTRTGSSPTNESAKRVTGQPAQSNISAGGSALTDDTRRRCVRPQLSAALRALGDRIEKPGKERLTLSGVLQRTGDTQATPFVAIYQQPGRLRFQDAQGLSARTITFNGQRAEKLGGSLTAEEEALVETLVYDTPEGFFSGQMEGAATRFLGPRFSADDGAAEDYGGPYYDIYQMADRVKVTGDILARPKLFLFNSDTQLLELVRYQVGAGGMITDVEVRLGDWQKTEDQMIPRRIVRLENNEPVLSLIITAVAFSPGVEDGLFSVSQSE